MSDPLLEAQAREGALLHGIHVLLERAKAAEAERDRLREALQRIADEDYLRDKNDGWQGMYVRPGRLARAALAGGTDAAPPEQKP